MNQAHGKFVTAITCMDGRIQLPVIAFLTKKYDANYVDLITEPGIDAAISVNRKINFAVRGKAEISVNVHGSKLIAIVGHHDCAGNPAGKEEHLTQIRQALTYIRAWELGVEVIGLWVNDRWQVEEVTTQ